MILYCIWLYRKLTAAVDITAHSQIMSHEIISTFSVAYNFFQAHKFHLIIFSKFLCRNFLMDEVLIAIVCVFPSLLLLAQINLTLNKLERKMLV